MDKLDKIIETYSSLISLSKLTLGGPEFYTETLNFLKELKLRREAMNLMEKNFEDYRKACATCRQLAEKEGNNENT